MLCTIHHGLQFVASGFTRDPGPAEAGPHVSLAWRPASAGRVCQLTLDTLCDNTYYQGVANELLAELKQTKPYKSMAQEAHISIALTAARLGHAFEETLKPYGITATQYNVLRILRGAGQEGLCRNEVRSRMVTSVPDVTRLLDRLEDLDLVTRERGVADRRHMTTRITKEGLRLLDRVDQPVIDSHERLIGHLDGRELKTLLGLLAKVRRGRQA